MADGKVGCKLSFEKLERQVADWHSRRFDGIDLERTALKLAEEVGEVAKAVLRRDRENALEEIGDCAIVLCHLARYFDTTLAATVAEKLPVLEERLAKYLRSKR